MESEIRNVYFGALHLTQISTGFFATNIMVRCTLQIKHPFEMTERCGAPIIFVA
jgi:hypothetical protein